MTYTEFIEAQLKVAAVRALQYFGSVTGTTKTDDSNQVLTEADLAIGRSLVNVIQGAYPDHNIIDEEAGVIDRNSQFTWVVDPIDGTSNFAAGSSDYGIMVGLLDGDVPIAGGIVLPSHDRLYLAEKGKGASCNGEPIRVTDETELGDALLSYGLDGYRDNPNRTVAECRVLADIVLSVRNMRNSGCEALDSTLLATGVYGARVNTTSKIWDNVAPQIIIEEAGGLWTAVDGTPIDYSFPLSRADQNFTNCSASPVLHAQLQKVIAGRLSNL